MSPTITVASFFRQTTECMRSGYFLQKLLKLLDQVRTREQILNVSRVKLSRYNVEYSVDETEWSSFHFFSALCGCVKILIFGLKLDVLGIKKL